MLYKGIYCFNCKEVEDVYGESPKPFAQQYINGVKTDLCRAKEVIKLSRRYPKASTHLLDSAITDAIFMEAKI